jgi:hypothetical protein
LILNVPALSASIRIIRGQPAWLFLRLFAANAVRLCPSHRPRRRPPRPIFAWRCPTDEETLAGIGNMLSRCRASRRQLTPPLKPLPENPVPPSQRRRPHATGPGPDEPGAR